MGIGIGEGEGRTREAARNAITSPLLEGLIEGAQKVILNITGGMDLTIDEVTEAASLIRDAVSDQADIFFGSSIKEGFDKIKLTVIATGFRPNGEGEREEFELGEEEIQPYRVPVHQHNAGNHRPKKDRHGDWDIPTFLRRRDHENER